MAIQYPYGDAPEIVLAQFRQLVELIEKDNSPCLRPQDVADLFGMDVNCLRSIAEKGCCPFAFCGRSGINGSRTMKIPKLAIWNWFMHYHKAFSTSQHD